MTEEELKDRAESLAFVATIIRNRLDEACATAIRFKVSKEWMAKELESSYDISTHAHESATNAFMKIMEEKAK